MKPRQAFDFLLFLCFHVEELLQQNTNNGWYRSDVLPTKIRDII